MCSGTQTAVSTGPVAAAKKLVFDSIVPPRWPGSRFATEPAAPSTSANVISTPPLTRPLRLRCMGLTRMRATTFRGVSETTRMPRKRETPWRNNVRASRTRAAAPSAVRFFLPGFPLISPPSTFIP